MQYRRFGKTYVLRLEKGDELVSSMEGFVKREKIAGGFFYGLGAVRDVSLGFFDVENKEYKKKYFEQDFELTSLAGDISFSGEKIIVHAHVTLADQDFKVVAGHCNRAVTTATVEVVFNPIEGKLEKKIDPETGLKLLDLGE